MECRRAAAGAGAGRAGGGGGGGRGRGAAITALKPGEWNPLDIVVTEDTLRASMGGGGSVADPNSTNYGNVAFYIGGTGAVRDKDVAWKYQRPDAAERADVEPVYRHPRQ